MAARMGTDPIQPPQPAPPPIQVSSPPAPSGAEAEYKSLLSLFKNLVWISGIALSIITLAATALVAIGSYFFWKNLSDVRQDAQQQAKQVATAESEKGVKAAFDEKNVNELVQKVAREKVNTVTDEMIQQKVGPIVDKTIEQQLTSKLQPIQQRILLIGRISELEIRIHRADRQSLEELIKITNETQDSDARKFARSTLDIVSDGYETYEQREIKQRLGEPVNPLDIAKSMNIQPGSPQPNPPTNLGGVVRIINNDQDLDRVAICIIVFRKMTGESKIRMFDFKAVNAWCADHKPQCAE